MPKKSNNPRKLVSFDWALKRLLRSKANFAVLEGFLSELLKREVKIREILESESNKYSAENKMNRVDLLVDDEERGRIIIEVQYESEIDYFQRMLFGVSRAVSESLKEGYAYGKLPPVISVNIVYFDLGSGDDYIYHGKTDFHGIHRGDTLALSELQQEEFDAITPLRPIAGILPFKSKQLQ